MLFWIDSNSIERSVKTAYNRVRKCRNISHSQLVTFFIFDKSHIRVCIHKYTSYFQQNKNDNAHGKFQD